MKLPLKWLADYVDIGNPDIKTYCEDMTATGSKVEGYEILGEDISNVVIGRLEAIEKHPDADKLVVCTVNVGKEAPLQIVTGAKNVKEGDVVPVALNGSTLPGGIKIKTGKLRGVKSEGMLCSIDELNLTTHDMPDAIEDGICILPSDAPIGSDIKDYLMLSDTVVEFEITPNRPDCLSVIGLARESAVTVGAELKTRTPVVENCSGKVEDYISVRVDEKELCPRYTARVVHNVKIEPSPLWMRSRLRAAGVRPINNIVDITNYVMLEYGQPMHAFDYKCLNGNQIIVRRASEGEIFKTLDSNDRQLKDSMLVIADAEKPVALAGIMGGENSEITDETKTVVFESANFYGAGVRITSRALGMRTESSGRFEKGLDPELTVDAVNRACELVQLLGAGTVAEGIIDVYGDKKPETVIKLNADKINEFLGTSIPEADMRATLEKLCFRLDGDDIHVPSYRSDVECMNDIAEEVIRIYGYNNIESTRFRTSAAEGKLTPKQKYYRGLCNTLCGMGMYEIETFSFISPKYYDKINLPESAKLRKSVVISNPLGEDTSVMRTTAIPSMLEVLARNNNFNNTDCSLYEMAKVYIPREGIVTNNKGIPGVLPEEKIKVVIGTLKGDFYSLKGVVEAVLDYSGVEGVEYEAVSSCPIFHPGRCAKIMKDGVEIGIFGQVNYAVCENYSIDRPVFLADLDFDSLLENAGKTAQYKPLPKFPAVTRDFSFMCDVDLEAAKIEKVMKKSLGKLLDGYNLFDIYIGEQTGGKKSISYSVMLRAADRTLTAEETDSACAKMLRALNEELGITIRT